LINVEHALGIDASHLCEAQDGHRLEIRTFSAFSAMQRSAAKDNIHINIASGYRDFARQKFIWDNKWQGLRPLYSQTGEPLDAATLTSEQKLHAILTWSALPGASRHHWGTDLDVYDKLAMAQAGQTLQLIPQEYSEKGPCSAMHKWLVRHAADFDFYMPYQDFTGGVSVEPWHLSYRPVAEKMLSLLTLPALKALLTKQNIQGKAEVLKRLPMIYHRYILNEGISDREHQEFK